MDDRTPGGFIICGGWFENPFVGDDVGVIRAFIGSDGFLAFLPPNFRLSKSMLTPATVSHVVGFFEVFDDEGVPADRVGETGLLLLTALLIG